MDTNQENMSFSEKRQTLTKLLLNLYSKYQNAESSIPKLYEDTLQNIKMPKFKESYSHKKCMES